MHELMAKARDVLEIVPSVEITVFIEVGKFHESKGFLFWEAKIAIAVTAEPILRATAKSSRDHEYR